MFSAWLQARRERAITLDAARERARRGATYLDGVDPDWYRSVDPDTLALNDGQACVLGQLHGDYRAGLGRAALLNFSSAPQLNLSPVAYGFQATLGVDDDLEALDYAYLDEAWQAEVRQRQAADAAVEASVSVPA